MRTCGNCRFYHVSGFCRQEPPKLTSVQPLQSAFPPVPLEWACGRHRWNLWRLLRPIKPVEEKNG